MPESGQPNPVMPDDALCIGCGYRLKGLAEPRCPECGRVFSPGLPSTYTRPGASGWVRRWVQRGPGWVVGGGVILTTLMMLYATSVPETYFGWYALGMLGVPVFGGLWSIRMLAGLVWLKINGPFGRTACGTRSGG